MGERTLSFYISDFINRTGKTIRWISEKSGVSYDCIRRCLQKESKPTYERAWDIMQAIGMELDDISHVSINEYGRTYLKDHTDTDYILGKKTAEGYAENLDTMLAYGLANKMSGTSEYEIEEHIDGNVNEILDPLYQSKAIRDINGRIRASDTFTTSTITFKSVSLISELGDKTYDPEQNEKNNASVIVKGFNEKGVKKMRDLIKYVKEMIHRFDDDPTLKGDKVCLLGIAKVELNEK